MNKFRFGFLLLVSLVLVLTACQTSSGSLQQIEVAEVTRSIFYAPQYIAVSEGFFEEEGLAVNITTTWGGDKTMTTLISGGADIALVGSETSIYVYQQGADDPVINFAQVTQTDGTFLVGRKKHGDFSWKDVKGSVFLGQRKGGMPQMVGEHVLKKHGIDPHQDLELIQNIDFANIASSFASGTGEYVQLFEPEATLFEMEGLGYVLASFGTESGHLPYTTFMAKQSTIESDSEMIQKFTNAVSKAQAFVYEQPAERVAEAMAPFFEDTDIKVIASVIERYKAQDSFDHNGILDEEEWNNLQDIIEEAGELQQRVDYSSLVNTSFAEKAMKN